MKIAINKITDDSVEIAWEAVDQADEYWVYWADANHSSMKYKCVAKTEGLGYEIHKSTHVPHYFKVAAVSNGVEVEISDVFSTPAHYRQEEQLEKLNRGLIAVPVKNGVFISWRMWLSEVSGYSETGLTGTDYKLYKNGQYLATITDSTNYLDENGNEGDLYAVAPVQDDMEGALCESVAVWEKSYLEIPMRKPEGGVTPAGEVYEYTANDMSIGDVNGDGEYEYIVKWDPTNSHDVSIKGYTGKQYLDCYQLDGTLLWRLDLGVNIRSGAHYTQFMVYDFDGDGKAEMAVKTAPGTLMTIYRPDGSVKQSFYVTMPSEDLEKGYSHQDNYVCGAEDYRQHMIEVFMNWQDHPEVRERNWPNTLEECFGIPKKYAYPLCQTDAEELVDYFLDVYAPSRSVKNELRKFEGFIYEGPEYLTMFAGDGQELQTIPFPMERQDDGLLWGDYAMKRIEPCNRVDRFLFGVGYLDGKRPYLIVCRGYYTRTTIVAYDFFSGSFREKFAIDSGHVPMSNPFCCEDAHDKMGVDPIYGCLAGQGNHSLSVADVDGDGCMEIIYGGATIDHDGSVLYSSYGIRGDGKAAKYGHGDAMHVAKIDPDRPGLQIFNVFEGASAVPYGYALRDAETGNVIFGEPADSDLGRCMIGKIDPNTRGYQVWVKDVYDCQGNRLEVPLLGTNQSIRFAADLTTQIIDGVEYIGTVQPGVINDTIHGVMLQPEDTATNNGTKGNPCLVADVFGDYREELLLRTKDSSAIRIYTNTDISSHKLFTWMHDTQYRCSVAWQNNCYNQPGYPKFYYGSDMDFADVLPYLK